MKLTRIFYSFVLLLALSSGLRAKPFTISAKELFNYTPSGAPIYLQSETDDYYRRIQLAGGSIGYWTLAAIDRFIVREKALGAWTAFKQAWVPVGDFAASKVWLVNPSGVSQTYNNITSSDYAQGVGYRIASNSNKWIETGFVPNSNGVTSTNLSLGMCTLTDDISANSSYIMGCAPANTAVEPNPFIGPQANIYGISTLAVNNCFAGEGQVFAAAYGTSGYNSVNNGELMMSNTSTTSVAFDNSLSLFRTQRTNGVLYYASGAIGFYFIGTEMTSAQLIGTSNAIEDLMIEIGRDCYQKLPLDGKGDSITAGTGPQNSRDVWLKQLAILLGRRMRDAAQGSSTLSTSTASAPFVPLITRYTAGLNNRRGLIAIMIGTNDMGADNATDGTGSMITTLSNNLATIIQAYQAQNNKVMVVNPPFRKDKTTNFQVAYRNAISNVAKTYRCAYYDAYSGFVDGGQTSSNSVFLADGVHPNAPGNLNIAQGAYEAYLGRLIGNPTLDFPSISSGSVSTLTTTIAGAVPGMTVVATPQSALESGVILMPPVITANDVVSVAMYNYSGAAVDPAALKYKITVQTNY